MLRNILHHLRQGWRPLAVTDILFKLIALVVLLPAVGGVFRFFLALTGRDVLADTDIARFLMHPVGWVTLVVIGAAAICLFAIEIAALMTVCIGVEFDRIPSARAALQFAGTKTIPLLEIACRVVIHCAVIAVPFLAVGGAVFWWLMTEHDINFYLSERPSEFLLAVGLIGTILAAMAALLFRLLIGWVYATPIVLFERLAAKEAMAESMRRARGDRKRIAVTLATWMLVNGAIGVVVSILTVQIAKSMIWHASGAMLTLVIALGAMILLVAISRFLASVFANMTLASSLALLYVSEHSRDQIVLPNWSLASSLGLGASITYRRGITAGIVLLAIAGLLGVSSLYAIQFDDQVQITAHRGGAFNAPENTMAAIDQGIRDGADWIEIDVQETLDGVVVVIHDSDLMKVSGNPVKIWEATAKDLQAIDIGSFFDPRFSDQRLPTLNQVLKACRGKAGVNIELKYYGHDQDLERKVVEIVESNEMADQIVVMSLEAAGIAKIKSLRPDWTVGLLTAVVAGDLTRADADFLAVKDSIATVGFIQSAHRQGKTVSAWTLNDAESMSVMISRGVDNLITDRPALAHRVIAQRKAMTPIERLSLEVAYYLDVQPKIDLGE